MTLEQYANILRCYRARNKDWAKEMLEDAKIKLDLLTIKEESIENIEDFIQELEYFIYNHES